MKSTAFDMAMVAYRQNDMEGAFRQFLSLAEAQDADAMNMAANMFERGQGTYRDPGRAVFWWKKAVELGNVDALADYGQYLVTVFLMARSRSLVQGIWLLRRSVATTGQERALWSLPLKITMLEPKYTGQQPSTATGLLPLRQILICVHSMCRKRVCLNISSDSTGLETIMYIWQQYFRQ